MERQIAAYIPKPFAVKEEGGESKRVNLVEKVLVDLAKRFKDRPGGYTRIIKLPDWRVGDGGDLVLLQLLTSEKATPKGARRSAGLRRKRNEKKHAFASKVAKGAKSEKAADIATT